MAAPASAQTYYWVDQAIRDCKAHKANFRSLAVSSIGSWWCIYSGDQTRGTGQDAGAVAACNRRLAANIRAQAPCTIVWKDGRIVDAPLYRALTRDYRVPVRIKSWDGVNKQEIDYQGFMIAGQSRGTGAATRSLARIVLRDGTELCKGEVIPTPQGRSQSFEALCLGNLRLKGKLRITGVVRVDGVQRMAAFDAEITNPPHRMRIWTP